MNSTAEQENFSNENGNLHSQVKKLYKNEEQRLLDTYGVRPSPATSDPQQRVNEREYRHRKRKEGEFFNKMMRTIISFPIAFF